MPYPVDARIAFYLSFRGNEPNPGDLGVNAGPFRMQPMESPFFSS